MHEINKKTTINGLTKYSHEVSIYTPNEAFHFIPPQFVRDNQASYWDVGFLDAKNMLFLETGVLNTSKFSRILFFSQWIQFLQLLIENKSYNKLFETFGFNESILIHNDRVLYEPEFFKHLKNFISSIKSKDYEASGNSNNKTSMLSFEEEFTADFIMYLCDSFKDSKNMISLSLLKQKILSNIKNFKELKLTSTFHSK
jgi:hypothetical protein